MEHIEQATAAPGEKRDVAVPTEPRCAAEIELAQFRALCVLPPDHDGDHLAPISAFRVPR